jgi:uncharacterized protein (TIGR00251 family)
VTIRVKVIPRSSKTEIVGKMADGTLKVRVAAAPEQGRANDALCEFLAVHFGLARSAVTIVSGHSAALKLVCIAGAAERL